MDHVSDIRGIKMILNGQEKVLNFWRVKLGNLYYVQGYYKENINLIQKQSSFEFATYKEAAWLFPTEKTAQRISNICGGEIEKLELNKEEYNRLYEIRESFIDKNELEWQVNNGVETFIIQA